MRTRSVPKGDWLCSPIVKKNLNQIYEDRDQPYAALDKLYVGCGFLFPARLTDFLLPLRQ
jgi:hypothetical protein